MSCPVPGTDDFRLPTANLEESPARLGCTFFFGHHIFLKIVLFIFGVSSKLELPLREPAPFPTFQVKTAGAEVREMAEVKGPEIGGDVAADVWVTGYPLFF